MAEAAIKAAVDAYMGSLITLTTKSGMRFEGCLLHLSAQERTIGLRNVKSFGTEERREGFVVSPSDKIYEYVVFHGSDIKDLRVISSSPSSQTSTPSVLDDPAIIESRDSLPPLQLTVQHSGLYASFCGASTSNHPVCTSSPGLLAPNHGCCALSAVIMDSVRRKISSVATALDAGADPASATKQVASVDKASRKFVLPSDLLPNVLASRSMQSCPGQFATMETAFNVSAAVPVSVTNEAASILERKFPFTPDLVPGVLESSSSKYLQSAITDANKTIKLSGNVEEAEQLLSKPAATTLQMLCALTLFKEDLDFDAKNNKFNKGVILGKSYKCEDKKHEEGTSVADYEDGGWSQQNVYCKRGYCEDNFYDSFSCNKPGDGSARVKFSDRRKKDSETFGVGHGQRTHWAGGSQGSYHHPG